MNGGLCLKNKICKIGILALSLTLFSGCGVENFFEIQSAMSPPKLSESQESVRVLIKNYFQKEIFWVYPKFEEKYSSVIDFKVSSANKNFKIAFCKVAEEKDTEYILWCIILAMMIFLKLICLKRNSKKLNNILYGGS